MVPGQASTDRSTGWINEILAVFSSVLACLTVIGCAESRTGHDVERFAKAHDTAEQPHATPPKDVPTEYVVDPNALRGLLPVAVDGGVALRPIEFTDRTKDGCPPELLAKAAKMLRGRIVLVWDAQNDRSSQKLYLVVTVLGEQSVFMDKDGHYIRLDSGAELVGINQVLQEYKFGREDLNSPQRVFQFLGMITFLHSGPRLIPCSSFALGIMEPISYWLRGPADNGADIFELCRDPEFVFEGKTWTVVFNVIKPDGGVDEWTVIGELDPEASSNEILRIDVQDVLPKGTFSYALFG